MFTEAAGARRRLPAGRPAALRLRDRLRAGDQPDPRQGPASLGSTTAACSQPVLNRSTSRLLDGLLWASTSARRSSTDPRPHRRRCQQAPEHAPWVSRRHGSSGVLLGSGTLELCTKTVNGAVHPARSASGSSCASRSRSRCCASASRSAAPRPGRPAGDQHRLYRAAARPTSSTRRTRGPRSGRRSRSRWTSAVNARAPGPRSCRRQPDRARDDGRAGGNTARPGARVHVRPPELREPAAARDRTSSSASAGRSPVDGSSVRCRADETGCCGVDRLRSSAGWSSAASSASSRHRVPRGESFVAGRSHCPSCGAQIARPRQHPGPLLAAAARALPHLRRARSRPLPADRARRSGCSAVAAYLVLGERRP